MLEKIRELHNRMKDLTLKAGVSEVKYVRVLRAIDKAPLNYAERVLLFLESVAKNEWAELNRIYTLPHITPEMWENYKILGIKNLDEQNLFNSAALALKKAWKNVPTRKTIKPKTNS
jgi:hypothetical protein